MPNLNDKNIPIIGEQKPVKIDSKIMSILQSATGELDPSQIIARALQLYADCLVFEAGGFLLTVVPVKIDNEKLVPDMASNRSTFVYPLSDKYLAIFNKSKEAPVAVEETEKKD